MFEKYADKDALTNIHNGVYLQKNYQQYIADNPDSRLIMFDFKRFKHYNDTYGHDIGDVYLKLFAETIQETFKDSLVVRIHGDEFVVVTKHSLEEIEKIFDLCDSKIKLAFQTEIIPELFFYNAGIVQAEHGIARTSEKADYMMYHAKKTSKRSQEFCEEIWNKKTKEDAFVKSINDDAKNSEFNYSSQGIYTTDKIRTDLECVYTKSKDNKSIFTKENYDFLRNNTQLRKIDLYNLQYLLLRLNSKDTKSIINFDYQSLLAKPDLVEYLELLVNVMKINSNNLVISINTNDIDYKSYNTIIRLITQMKNLGFGICIDKYNSRTGDGIYENAPIDYVKFDCEYCRSAIANPKIGYSLMKKIEMFTDYEKPAVPIFTCVETEAEFAIAQNITTKPILLSGNYFEVEKKMILKKDL